MSITLVSTVTVGSGGAASIEFTSIPQTGTDLVLVVSSRSDRSSAFDQLYVQFNLDTNQANYSQRSLHGTGSTVNSTNASNFVPYLFTRDTAAGNVPAATSTASTFGNSQIFITNYASTTSKSISFDGVGEQNATASGQELIAARWNNTSAVTRVTCTLNSNFVQHSTASLYLITKGSGGATVS